jgi:hypothetical protein
VQRRPPYKEVLVVLGCNSLGIGDLGRRNAQYPNAIGTLERRADGNALSGRVIESGVSFMWLTGSLMELLVAAVLGRKLDDVVGGLWWFAHLA